MSRTPLNEARRRFAKLAKGVASEVTDLVRSTAKTVAHGAAQSVESVFEAGRSRLVARLDLDQPRFIQPYRGWATRDEHGIVARVWGRVLENRAPGGPGEDDGLWRNLLGTYRRWETDEVPHVPVEIELLGETLEVYTDDEGYFRADVRLPASPIDERVDERVDERAPDGRWIHATVRLEPKVSGDSTVMVSTEAPILVPSRHATVGVISDVDDTILHTDATSLWTTAKLTFLGNARTRKALPGVAALYRALRDGVSPGFGDGNPILYVSSSPWNLYDLLDDFLELNDIPVGPLLLRDFGVDDTKLIAGGHEHKLEKASMILELYPDLPFVCIGDSGQEDARLYAELVERHPGRVRAVYIRDVDPGADSAYDTEVDRWIESASSHDVPMLRIADSRAIAAHAAELDLILPSAVGQVAEAVERDLNRPKL